jgi:hypothetical protein
MCFQTKPMRFVVSALCAAFAATHLDAATLARLSLDDMIRQSTAIIHGRVGGSSAAFRGSVIYTSYKVQVLEQWKGNSPATVDVALPGGSANGYRQSFPGTPQLTEGQEYILFLWTSKSGLTQIIGLTQGLFDLSTDASGVATANRGASSNSMLDPVTGRMVKDEAIQMLLKDLTSRISSTLAKGSTN